MYLDQQLKDKILASDFYASLRDGVLAIDNSSYTNWDGCDMKGLLAGALRLQPTRGVAPLRFGSAVHAGLEALHRGYTLEESIDIANAVALKEKLHEVADERRNQANLEPLLRGYVADYALRPNKFNPVEVNGEPLVETSFSFPLGTVDVLDDYGQARKITVRWDGKIDMVAFYKEEVWVVDHKTTSVMGERFADDKFRSSQMLGYIWAVRNLTRQLGHKVRGVVINAIAMRKNGFDYQTFDLPFPEWKVKEWEIEVLHSIENMLNRFFASLRSGVSTPTREHCVTKYGKCPFFEGCELMPQMRLQYFTNPANFTVSNWSPHD